MPEDKLRTIVVMVDDATGKSRSYLVGHKLSAHAAHVEAVGYAAFHFPNKNYWYRSVNHYQGSRIALVHCTKKGT